MHLNITCGVRSLFLNLLQQLLQQKKTTPVRDHRRGTEALSTLINSESHLLSCRNSGGGRSFILHLSNQAATGTQVRRRRVRKHLAVHEPSSWNARSRPRRRAVQQGQAFIRPSRGRGCCAFGCVYHSAQEDLPKKGYQPLAVPQGAPAFCRCLLPSSIAYWLQLSSLTGKIVACRARVNVSHGPTRERLESKIKRLDEEKRKILSGLHLGEHDLNFTSKGKAGLSACSPTANENRLDDLV